MAYGDYSGPDKPNKGKEGGACNRSSCQAEPALWYNHGSLSWYCADCRQDIEFDSFNQRDWLLSHQPHLGHPMFETRQMMLAREIDKSLTEMATQIRRGAAIILDSAEPLMVAMSKMDYSGIEQRVRALGSYDSYLGANITALPNIEDKVAPGKPRAKVYREQQARAPKARDQYKRQATNKGTGI